MRKRGTALSSVKISILSTRADAQAVAVAPWLAVDHIARPAQEQALRV
ncbi:hypothetical protein [Micromonospora tulbaghiae]